MDKVLRLYAAMQLRMSGLFEEKERDKGATATEYAILVAFIALVVAAGATLFGNALSTWFGSLASSVGGWSTS